MYSSKVILVTVVSTAVLSHRKPGTGAVLKAANCYIPPSPTVVNWGMHFRAFKWCQTWQDPAAFQLYRMFPYLW